MSEKTIVMSYHPALKKVKFESEYGDDISERYSLEKWTETSFVLQDQGSDFFNDILHATDGVQKVNVIFNGTDVDYEDFCAMIDYFNRNSDKKIYCSKGKSLPDMKKMYNEIKKLGVSAIDVLQKRVCEIPYSSVSYEVEDRMIADLKKHISKINQKIDRLESTNINICFVGTYSSGKSSLINAILQERILPEADESKTAKFFIISSSEDKGERIEFHLGGIKTEIFRKDNVLQLDGNCASHEMRQNIQQCLDDHSSEHISKQVYAVLDLINNLDDVGTEINVYYNIPINSDGLSFTIYDTPGTGSNTADHKLTLQRALADQENSIVVFVGGVAKLEGEGNSELLKLLNNSENRIDIDRSVFVINRADSSTQSKLSKYWCESIKIIDSEYNSESESNKPTEIPLKDKKLFFTSASQATAAKAILKGIQNEDDTENYEKIAKYNFYQFNRCGNSDMARDRMILNANAAYEKADNEYEKAYIKVGLYSLVEAIKEYGHKYAMAVKVNSLVEAVDHSLDSLEKSAKEMQDICEGDVEKYNKELERIRSNIQEAVNGLYNSCKISGKDIPQEKREKLKLDPKSLVIFQEEIKDKISHQLKSGKKKNIKKRNVKSKYIDPNEIYKEIEYIMGNFGTSFAAAEDALLKDDRDSFIKDIIKTVNDDPEISAETKERLLSGLSLNTDVSYLNSSYSLSQIRQVIDENTKTHKFLFIEWEVVDTYKVRTIIGDEIDKICAENADRFTNAYNNNHNQIIDTVKKNFDNNVDDFSTQIKDIKKDKDRVLRIASKIRDTAAELENLKKNLDDIAWRKYE